MLPRGRDTASREQAGGSLGTFSKSTGGCACKEQSCALPAPAKLHPRLPSSAVDALQAVLIRSGNEDVVQRMELDGGWQLLKTSAGHEEGVTQLAR